MKRLYKPFVTVITLVIVLTIVAPLQVEAASVGGQEISSKGACVIDYETGIVLFGYEENKPMVPASMTKLIAVYVIYDAVRAGEITLDTVAVISESTGKLSVNWEFSNVPLQAGMSVTIRELLDVVIVWSACAATRAMGEALCGSEEAFVARMNDKVARLGIDARFFDSYGVSADNYISPLGMARLARYLILNHPEVLGIASKRSVTFQGVEYKNTNQLLGNFTGADGLKTGYTDAAMFCFVGTARQNNRRIIAVTMGSTFEQRFPDARLLLEQGFATADRKISEFVNTKAAYPSGANLLLNGEEMPLTAYLIGGNHYFKLRDIAFLLSGTVNQFEVVWNDTERSVRMTSGGTYTPGGSELAPVSDAAQQYLPTPARIFLDNVEYAYDVFLIEGTHYFKLRDLAALTGFSVDWINETRTVIIDAEVIAVAEPEDGSDAEGELEGAEPGSPDKEDGPNQEGPPEKLSLVITYAGVPVDDFSAWPGEEVPLRVRIEPAGASPPGKVTWSSSDTGIFTVAADNANGTAATVTAIRSGTAVLTITTDGVSAECIVRVR